MSTHASSAPLLTYLLPLCGISLAERLRDGGNDVVVGFDDLSKHSKAYRQMCLLNGG